jgi:hypothetical protein
MLGYYLALQRGLPFDRLQHQPEMQNLQVIGGP